MSSFINGDRLIYVSPNVTPPLPRDNIINGHPCKVWHASQNNFCKRCSKHGHKTNDVEMCESFDPDSAVAAFRADSNPLSNYFMCTINEGNLCHKSAEHFYQREFCLHCNNPDVALQIYSSPTPRKAKEIATQLKANVNEDDLASWDRIKLSVMEYVLLHKWNSSAKFRQSIMCTEGMTIAEATQDCFWGVGVAPNLAQFTKPIKFLGANHLGQILMSIRSSVAQRCFENQDDKFILPPPLTPRISTYCDPTLPGSYHPHCT